jgi:hypothetical protein
LYQLRLGCSYLDAGIAVLLIVVPLIQWGAYEKAGGRLQISQMEMGGHCCPPNYFS